jgi:hypothetical protein
LKTKLRQKQIQLEEKRRKKSLADKSANPVSSALPLSLLPLKCDVSSGGGEKTGREMREVDGSVPQRFAQNEGSRFPHIVNGGAFLRYC